MISIYSGYMTERHPVATDTLVFTSDDPAMLATLAETFGGELSEQRLISNATEVTLHPSSIAIQRDEVSIFGKLEGLGFALFRTTSPTVLADVADYVLDGDLRTVVISLEPGRVRRQRVAVVA
jgi:hypothetical protein